VARIVVHVLVLSIFSFLAPASAQQADPHPCLQDPLPVSRERSGNIRFDDVFQPVISGLLAKSETFRRQWDAINSSRFIRVTVVLHLGMQIDGSARARTELSRYAHGSIRARIELPGATDLTELLAHEFEHVIEQLEGIDLRVLAQRHEDGVVEIQNGVFETARARAAGRQVYREVYGDTDPAVQAALGGMRRAWRMLNSRSRAETTSKTHETRRNRHRGGAIPPGAHLHKRW